MSDDNKKEQHAGKEQLRRMAASIEPAKKAVHEVNVSILSSFLLLEGRINERIKIDAQLISEVLDLIGLMGPSRVLILGTLLETELESMEEKLGKYKEEFQ